MALIRTLVDCDKDDSEPAFPQGLRDQYDGALPLSPPPAARPFVLANFVSTLDGVVSYGLKGQAGGSTISGADPADRFIMGLLRASADAVIVGARTLHDAGRKSLWTPEYTYPEAKDLYKDYRANILHKPEYPLVVVVSGSGRLELESAVFHTPGVRIVVMTTSAGSDALARAGATKMPSVEIQAFKAENGALSPLAMLEVLSNQYGIRRLLHEGGPTLFGQFMAAEVIDELFLTLSPQIAGRSSGTMRPALVEGTEFVPASAPWFQLLSVKQSGDHLYFRYRRTGPRA